MAFNYKLLGQVKQACIKLAAPVPPEEVTAPKPYVKPPELEPQQPKVQSPSERIIAGANMYENSVKKMTPMDIREMKQPQKPKNLIDPGDFRLEHKIPPDADLSAYPELQKEWLKRWAETENYVDQVKFYDAGGDLKRYQNLKDTYIKDLFGNPLNYEYFKFNAHHEPTATSIVGQGNLRQNQTDYYRRMQERAAKEKLRLFN